MLELFMAVVISGWVGAGVPETGILVAPVSAAHELNLFTIGDDIVEGKRWTPQVDFSGGELFYFDPSVPTGGVGTKADPFTDLATAVADNDVIRRFVSQANADAGTPVDNSFKNPVMGAGDVCVLMAGDHGKVDFERFFFSDYMGIIRMPGAQATLKSFSLAKGSFFYLEDLVFEERAREDWDNPGTMTRAGFNTAPDYIRIELQSGNGPVTDVVIKDCILSGGTALEATTWDETTWLTTAVNGIQLDRAHRVHIQGNTGSALNYFIQGGGTDPSPLLYLINIVDNYAEALNGDGFSIGNSVGVYVARNYIAEMYTESDNHVDMIQGHGISKSHWIEDNVFIASTDPSRLPFDNDFSGIQYTNPDSVIVENNIVVSSSVGGIKFSQAADSTYVRNNTVISYENSPPTNLLFEAASTNTWVYNNVAGNITGAAFVTDGNNLFYVNDFTNAKFTNYTLGGDPSLWFLLPQSDSPLIDTGNAAQASPQDIRGVLRPQGAADDVGAYERVPD